MQLKARVIVDLAPMRRFQAALKSGGRSGPIRAALKQWGVRYRSFLEERFVSFSRGGGDWPDLRPSTKARRRSKAKSKAKRGSKGAAAQTGTFAILRDTGILFASLTPRFVSAPGQVQEDIPFGIRVGIGGPARHPSGKATIGDIAVFHQTGAGLLPVRKIVVDPDDATCKAMADDMDHGLAQLSQETGNT